MLNVILGGTIAIVSSAVTSVLHYWFSRAAELRREERDARVRAYTDYVSAFYDVVVRQTHGEEVSTECWVALGHAQAKVAVYGDPAVIQAVAGFWRLGAQINTEEGRRAFLAICNGVRRTTYGKDRVSDDDMSQLLLCGPLAKTSQPIRAQSGGESVSR